MYDYVGGKLDWIAAGLPSEGTDAEKPTAGSAARPSPPTCRLDETVGEARARARAAGLDVCVVVNGEGIVLGLLRADELEGPEDARVEGAMRPAPSTFRPHVPIAEMADYMTEHDLASAPITTSEGKLLGLLYREDALALQKR